MVGRKTHAVHQQLPFVERTEIGRRCVAKPDDAEQFIIGGIDDRYRVRELVGRVETIFVTDRDVRRTRGSGRLASKRRDDSGKKKRGYKANFHDQYPRGSVVAIAAVTASRMQCGSLVQTTLHQLDFLLLFHDDPLGEAAQNWIV